MTGERKGKRGRERKKKSVEDGEKKENNREHLAAGVVAWSRTPTVMIRCKGPRRPQRRTPDSLGVGQISSPLAPAVRSFREFNPERAGPRSANLLYYRFERTRNDGRKEKKRGGEEKEEEEEEEGETTHNRPRASSRKRNRVFIESRR